MELSSRTAGARRTRAETPRAGAPAAPQGLPFNPHRDPAMTSDDASTLDVLDAVQERYSKGARAQVPELCCPVDYDASLLEVLPEEIIERDYGCGDPSRFVRPGETVLDLGAGAGKICYMASQLVGSEGRVIGVDATADMLALGLYGGARAALARRVLRGEGRDQAVCRHATRRGLFGRGTADWRGRVRWRAD